ncbi:MAG: hypothetical protein JWP52_4020 [Rhizobacter sp.]|nr:hypothetical protein [Rhizobacter sp.]
MPAPIAPAPTTDLTDAEFQELDELLAATPEPLEPVDVMMLDGYLCGVVVQPKLLNTDTWMPFVFDFDGQPLPPETDAAWLSRTQALVLRRHGAITRSIVEDGWFDPLILEADPEAEAEANAAAKAETDAKADGDEAAEDASDDGAEPAYPYAGLDLISQTMLPWVAGFQHATACFPELLELPDESVMTSIARVFRHLPAETDEERELHETFQREQPFSTLDEAVEDLVAAIADLEQLTREDRFRVENIRREGPKVGRNDPCPCGSGKKYKNCHGAA